MVIQLPNKQWINPEAVDVITVFWYHEKETATVRVNAGENGWIDLEPNTLEVAEQLRDQIAEQVNRAILGGKV